MFDGAPKIKSQITSQIKSQIKITIKSGSLRIVGTWGYSVVFVLVVIAGKSAPFCCLTSLC
ncbi:hypothetical protein CWC48_14750 [Pseudomonas sp. S10E 269]|nr:hypothetical protein CWC49_24900 [Pseudomonas sp. S09F 262]PJK40348.1 hypothetical protein CWC48_14750 [Pseudomonas sp. S10E 269]